MISVITATFNSSLTINHLIDSLRAQSFKNFEWIVADGGSTDGTLDILQSVKDLNIKIDSRKDFGIYDALNRAVNFSNGEYYLVVGSDDTLEPNALESFSNVAHKSNADLIVFNIRANKRIVKHNRKRYFWRSQCGFVAGHSVGTLIKKNLHAQFGLYSKRFPIAADTYFLECVYRSGANIYYKNMVAGSFGTLGVSSKDQLGALTEAFRVQIDLGGNKIIETVIFILRLIRHYGSL